MRCTASLLFLVALVSPVWAEEKPRRFVLNHTMEYEYDRPVTLGPHTVRVLPQAWVLGRVVETGLLIKFPGTHSLRRLADAEGNLVASVHFEGETKSLVVQNSVLLEIPTKDPLLEPRVEARAMAFPVVYLAEESKRLAPYLEVPADLGPRLAKFSHELPREQDSSVAWVRDLAQKVQKDVKCFVREGEGVLSPEETLDKGGSCRDLAWLTIQVLRRKGLPARFVSGYQIPPWALAPGPGPKKVHPAELHAWVEVYLPGAGWLGLDPTTGQWTNATYVPLAVAAQPRDAGPLQGTFAVSPMMMNAFAKSTLRFRVTVEEK